MYKWAFFVRLIWVIFSIGKSGPFFFSCGLQIYFAYLSFIHWPVSDYLSFSSSVLSIILRKKKEKKMTWIIRYFYFQPLCTTNLWRLLDENRAKHYPRLVQRNFDKFFFFSVFSFYCRLENAVTSSSLPRQILQPKQKVHRTSKPNSFRKVWKNRNYDVVSWYDHSCYMWKIRLSVPGCSDRIAFTSVLVLRKTLISL